MYTDFASVPRFARLFVNNIGPWLEASVVHDYLCIAWRWLDGQGSAERRKFSDDIMLAAMEAAGVGFRRHIIYAAIRAYGRFARPVVEHRQWAEYSVDLDALPARDGPPVVVT